MESLVVLIPILRQHPTRHRQLNRAERLLHDRGINHFRSHRDRTEAPFFGLSRRPDNTNGALGLGFRRCHFPMHDRNLARMDATDAVETETPFALHIGGKGSLVFDVRKHRSDRLYTSRAGRVDRCLASEKALPALRRPRSGKLGRKVFETERQRDHRWVGGGDFEGAVNSAWRLEDRHQKSGPVADQALQGFGRNDNLVRFFDLRQENGLRVVISEGCEIFFKCFGLLLALAWSFSPDGVA